MIVANRGLSAIVLTGGRSSRMGCDKALLSLDGETWIARVVAAVSEVATEGVVVVAAVDQRLPVLAARIVRDERPYAGPLAALALGLRALPVSATSCFVAATDLVRLRPSVARRVAVLLGSRDAAIPVLAGTGQYLAAAYAPRIASVVERMVASGERSMRALAASIDARLVSEAELLEDPVVAAEDPRLESFRDADTPEDAALL